MKKNMMGFICVALLCVPLKGYAQWDDESEQDDFKFLSIGIGAGGFFANKYVANYYNGHPSQKNKITYVLNNRYWHEDIQRDEFDGFNFKLEELPRNMRYKVSTMFNFRVAMNVSAQAQIFFQVDQVNLTTTDIFTLELPDKTPYISEPYLVLGQIWGKESRTMLNLGFQSSTETDVRELQWFYELAFNLTNTKVKENAIQIGDFTQSILDRGEYIPGQQMYDPMLQSAIGIGLAGSLGINYQVHPNASLDVGLTCYVQDIRLEGYEKFKPSFNLFARINLLTF